MENINIYFIITSYLKKSTLHCDTGYINEIPCSWQQAKFKTECTIPGSKLMSTFSTIPFSTEIISANKLQSLKIFVAYYLGK